MSAPYTAPTAPDIFYLQYHIEGQSGGEWNASTSSSSAQFFKLDQWVIEPGATYIISVNAKQGTGNAQPAFAAFTFDGSNYWGAKLPEDGSYVMAGPNDGEVTAPDKAGVQLTARGGIRVGGDPQVNVGGFTNDPTGAKLSISWDGENWTDGNDNIISSKEPVSLLMNDNTSYLTVIDDTGKSNTAALYRADGTLYQQPQPLDSKRYATVFTITTSGTYYVNVFNDSGDAKTR